ncbi:hypothetical protein [Ornithinimicrobium murale]|uniref:hypothetical protein n=1 Tax=Ornithinimicrobium murale TaxID=1050153 RepID=UPI000E0DCF69|nr:hypothetical protein [Ornithinimicrobium murale]
MSTVTVPAPLLTYTFHLRDLDYTTGGSLPLARVHDVTVSLDVAGEPSVWVTGRVLMRDGTPGPGRRSSVDPSTAQPEWLRDVLADALPRLGGV